MTSKLIQKFLIFIFTATFFTILTIGIGRARKASIQQAVIPVAPANTPTAPATSTAQKEPPAVKQKPKNLKFTGTTYGTPFGQVTVAIDIENGKITSVETPDYPDSGPSIYARPYLIDQALSAGSADIQGVSGATYTSFAFQHSLESAIVSAGSSIF